MMKLVACFASLVLTACASAPRYATTYELGGKTSDSVQAERQVVGEFDKAAQSQAKVDLDRPVRLIRAPQPVMSPADIEANVQGEVTAEIWFNEAGTVDRVVVLKSSKESLAQAVVGALSKWEITPRNGNGKSGPVIVRQSFVFRGNSKGG